MGSYGDSRDDGMTPAEKKNSRGHIGMGSDGRRRSRSSCCARPRKGRSAKNRDKGL